MLFFFPSPSERIRLSFGTSPRLLRDSFDNPVGALRLCFGNDSKRSRSTVEQYSNRSRSSLEGDGNTARKTPEPRPKKVTVIIPFLILLYPKLSRFIPLILVA